MRRIVDDQRLIFKCCKLYYEEDMSQQQIADKFGISRVSVSRMLKAGKDSGMVTIRISSPDVLQYSQIEQELEKLFKIREAVVVENSPLDTMFDHITAIANETIRILETYIKEGDIVGVSMGRTLMNVAKGQRTGSGSLGCIFVPIVGGVSSGHSSDINIHSNRIAQEFAKLFQSEYIDFYSPAMFSNKALMQGFMKEKMMQTILDYYRNMNTVIVGIGIPVMSQSSIYQAGYVTKQELNELLEMQVVGDIALQFYDKDGCNDQFESFNERVAGMHLRNMRKVKNRIGIGTGKEKAEAIMGALAGGYINILITDEECAKELIAMKKGESV